MRLLSRNDQGGRSMVEMLGVLAIIGVLSVGGISGYSKAMAKYKLTKAQDQITMLLMNIRTAYATSPSYAGLCESAAAFFNLAPQEMVGADKASLYGTFGGSVFVGATSSSMSTHATTGKTSASTGNYFYITLTQLGKEACRSLATSDWGADGLVKMIVGSSTYNTASLPVSLQYAAANCNNETTSITWIYY